MKKILFLMLFPIIAFGQTFYVFPNAMSPDTTLYTARLGTDSSMIVRYTVGSSKFVIENLSIIADTAWADSMDIEILAQDSVVSGNPNHKSFKNDRIIGKVQVVQADFTSEAMAAGNGKYCAFKSFIPIYFNGTSGNSKMPVRIIWRSSTAKVVGKNMVITFGGRQQ